MTIIDALRGLTGYPIPAAKLDTIAVECAVGLGDEFTPEIAASLNYKWAMAKVYRYLSEAPNISQGGVSYSFSADDRTRFASKSSSLLASIGYADEDDAGAQFGFKGSVL